MLATTRKHIIIITSLSCTELLAELYTACIVSEWMSERTNKWKAHMNINDGNRYATQFAFIALHLAHELTSFLINWHTAVVAWRGMVSTIAVLVGCCNLYMEKGAVIAPQNGKQIKLKHGMLFILIDNNRARTHCTEHRMNCTFECFAISKQTQRLSLTLGRRMTPSSCFSYNLHFSCIWTEPFFL